MWGWLSSIVGGLETVWQAITNLPQLIADKLSNFLTDIKNDILGLPQLILDGIKDIFVPDTEVLNDKFENFLETMKMKFNFETDFFESVFSGEQPVEDIRVDYTIPGVGAFNLKVFEAKYFIEGVTYFRPFIRGFLVLLMALYNVQQTLRFIRQDAGVVTGKAVSVSTKGEEQ